MALDENKGACSSDLYNIGFELLLSKLFFRQICLPWAKLMQASGPGHELRREGIRGHEGAAEEIVKKRHRVVKGPRARPVACNAPCLLCQIDESRWS